MADQDDKDQKTEEPTARRREETRDKGQVAMSQEFIAAMMLVAGAGALILGGGLVARHAASLAADTLRSLSVVGTDELSIPSAAAVLRAAVSGVMGTVAAVFIPVILLGGMVGYLQVGFRVTPKAVEVDLTKLDVVKGAKRLFGPRGIVRTTLAAAKVFLIGTAMIMSAWMQIPNIIRLGDSELGPTLAGLGQIALRSTFVALIVVVLLALVDLAYQRYQSERDMRMSKQEIKEEQRITEGDPHVKARVRQIQRESATRRMMSDVPTSTVVVTNPTHYAVALRYARDDGGNPTSSAPVVVAKGVDEVAQRIKAVAAAADVPLHEDVPLARALHGQCELGEEIPEDLYAAVATVLSRIYRLQGVAA